jgi:hypothetical protein
MKTFFLILFTLGLLLPAAPLKSASPADNTGYHTINGVVRDARTHRNIAFASVYLPGTSVGTVANLDGAFTIKIQKSLDIGEFCISHLGYRVAQFPIEENLGYGKVFTLNAHSVDLPEVIIRPTDPRELVRSAIDKVAENYPIEPNRLTAFYREAIRQRRDYVSISEAIVDIYQAPYAYSYESDRMKIVRGRKSGDVKKADTLIVKLQGGPHVSMLLDIVKNPNVILDRESLSYYDYEFLDIVKIEDETNYVIGFKPRVILPFPLYEGKLYISIENLALTMAEFSLDLSNRQKAAQNFILKRPAGLRFTPLNTNYLVTYKQIDGRYHVNYVRSELEFFADWRRRIFRTNYNVMAEMAITDRDSENVDRFSIRESFRPNTILADMVPVYFEDEFWGDYNYIEPEESIESAIQKINRTFER